MKKSTESERGEINYEQLLEIRHIDQLQRDDRSLSFVVADNFNVFLSTLLHYNLFKEYGVDPDTTLTEGRVFFNKNKSIKEVEFKRHPYQPNSGFIGSPEELKKLQEAVEKMIRSTIGIEPIRTD